MKQSVVMILCVVFLVTFSGILIGGEACDAVAKVINGAYFNGAFNDLDTVSMKKGFHTDFAIFSAKGNELGKYPIATWIKGIEKKKSDPAFDPKNAVFDCKIVKLDVTGGCASAKVEIHKKGTLIYTDYLSLLKFDDGWKIVAKVYHSHQH